MSEMKRNSMQICYMRKVMVREEGRGSGREICNFGFKEHNNHTGMSHNLFKLQCGIKDRISKMINKTTE